MYVVNERIAKDHVIFVRRLGERDGKIASGFDTSLRDEKEGLGVERLF